jgi:hypothetical protein
MDDTRVPTLTHPYEEFFTSAAGLPDDFTMYTARIDDDYTSHTLASFATVTVCGSSFTVKFYHTGTTAPVWTETFTKSVPPPGSAPTGSFHIYLPLVENENICQ